MLHVCSRRFIGYSLVSTLLGAAFSSSTVQGAFRGDAAEAAGPRERAQAGAFDRFPSEPNAVSAPVLGQGETCFALRGWVGLEETALCRLTTVDPLGLAHRIEARGLRLLLDIQDTNTWANPTAQPQPAARRELPLDYWRVSFEAFTECDRAAIAPSRPGKEIAGNRLWPVRQIDHSLRSAASLDLAPCIVSAAPLSP